MCDSFISLWKKKRITQLVLLVVHAVAGRRVEESEEVAHRVHVEERNLLLQERVLCQGEAAGVLQSGHAAQHQYGPHPALVAEHDVRGQPARAKREDNTYRPTRHRPDFT